MPVMTTPAMSPSVSLSPHTPSNDNASFTADIILPEDNELVRADTTGDFSHENKMKISRHL